MPSDTLNMKVHEGMQVISTDGVSVGKVWRVHSGIRKPVSRYAHIASRIHFLTHLRSDKSKPTQAISLSLGVLSPK